MRQQTKGAALSLFGGACWGLSGSMGQYLFTVQGMDSRWLVPIRLGFAGLIMLLYCLIRYGKETFSPWMTKRNAIRLILYGIPGVAFSQFLYFLTIQLSSAGIGTIMQDLAPIMVLLYTCAIAKRRPKRTEIFSLILAIAGVFLLATHGNVQHLVVSPTALLTGILSAVAVTIYNVAPGDLLHTYPIVLLQGWAFLTGGGIIALIFRPWTIDYVPNAIGLFGIAFVILVGNVLAFSCYMSGVGLIGADKAMLYSFAEPITAAIITTCFMGNAFGLMDALGFLLIFFMLILISADSLNLHFLPHRNRDSSASSGYGN